MAVKSLPLAVPSSMKLDIGVVQGVSNDAWTTVTLDDVYASMVVVATPLYDETSEPLVTRITNVGASSFDLKIERMDNSIDAVPPVSVHYVAVEEGSYNAGVDGVTSDSCSPLVSSIVKHWQFPAEAMSLEVGAITTTTILGSTSNEPFAGRQKMECTPCRVVLTSF